MHYFVARKKNVPSFFLKKKNSSHYPAIGGTSLDFYGESSIPFVFNAELPDLGEYGFLIPSNQIDSVNEQRKKKWNGSYIIFFCFSFKIVNGLIEGLRRMTGIILDKDYNKLIERPTQDDDEMMKIIDTSLHHHKKTTTKKTPTSTTSTTSTTIPTLSTFTTPTRTSTKTLSTTTVKKLITKRT